MGQSGGCCVHENDANSVAAVVTELNSGAPAGCGKEAKCVRNDSLQSTSDDSGCGDPGHGADEKGTSSLHSTADSTVNGGTSPVTSWDLEGCSDAGSEFGGSMCSDASGWDDDEGSHRLSSKFEPRPSSKGTSQLKSYKRCITVASKMLSDSLGTQVFNPNVISKSYKFGKNIHTGSSGIIRMAGLKITDARRAVQKIAIRGQYDITGPLSDSITQVNAQIETGSRLDHPNIVRLYEVFEGPQHVFLVLEYCNDGSIAQHLGDTGLEEVDAAAVFKQILRALHYMQSHLVCHRNLSLSHVLVKRPPDKSRKLLSNQSQFHDAIRISNFSMACKVSSTFESLSAICGPASHRSPQMFAEQYTLKTDLWSAGVLLFQMLSNSLPFQGSNEAELRASIKSGVVACQSAAKKPSEDAMQLVKSLLQQEEKDRLTSSAAQKYRWLTSLVPTFPPQPVSSQTLKRLRAFRGLDKFKQTFLKVVVHMLKDVSVAASRKIFVQFDENGDGFVTVSELSKAMKEIDCKDADIEKMTKALHSKRASEVRGPVDEEPVITFSEFLAATFNRERHSDDKLWREAFAFFDKDLSGTLDRQELVDGLLGELTPSEVEKLLAQLDVDGDNKVSYNETVKVMAATAVL